MNKYFRNILLVIFIVVVVLLILEGLTRLVFEPIDFLKPSISSDEVLRYKIDPGSGAHDSWGYRNKSVPDSSDIVALGDSHTYGISATAADSWPSALERISGRKTYNLALGGYGPAEYLYLMEEKALSLNPEIIIAGFYLGNDLKDSLKAVRTVPIWEDLRGKAPLEHSDDSREVSKSGFSDFLAGNSVLYRIVSSSFIGDKLRQRSKISKGEEIIMLEVDGAGVSTGFTPHRRLKGLDLLAPDVREGLRLSLELINRMNKLALKEGVNFLVVIIPTKEAVYSEYILDDHELSQSPELSLLIQNEDVVNKVVKRYFSDHNIAYIEVLKPLQDAAASEQIYPNNFGGHTNKNGYRIIAETINQYIQADKPN